MAECCLPVLLESMGPMLRISNRSYLCSSWPTTALRISTRHEAAPLLSDSPGKEHWFTVCWRDPACDLWGTRWPSLGCRPLCWVEVLPATPLLLWTEAGLWRSFQIQRSLGSSMGPRSPGWHDYVMSRHAQKVSEQGHKAPLGWLHCLSHDILQSRCPPAGSGSQSWGAGGMVA